MRFTLALAVLAGVAGMTGCASAVAIHPLYTEQQLVSDLPLEGTWASGDGEAWQIQKSGDGYDVVALKRADSPGGAKYTVHLLRLNEFHFVDVASKSDPDVGVPGHFLAKVQMQDGKLYVSPLDDTWFKHMMDAGVAPSSTMGEGQQIVITASTAELQKFLLLYAADPDAWTEDDEGLRRLQ